MEELFGIFKKISSKGWVKNLENVSYTIELRWKSDLKYIHDTLLDVFINNPFNKDGERVLYTEEGLLESIFIPSIGTIKFKVLSNIKEEKDEQKLLF